MSKTGIWHEAQEGPFSYGTPGVYKYNKLLTPPETFKKSAVPCLSCCYVNNHYVLNCSASINIIWNLGIL